MISMQRLTALTMKQIELELERIELDMLCQEGYHLVSIESSLDEVEIEFAIRLNGTKQDYIQVQQEDATAKLPADSLYMGQLATIANEKAMEALQNLPGMKEMFKDIEEHFGAIEDEEPEHEENP